MGRYTSKKIGDHTKFAHASEPTAKARTCEKAKKAPEVRMASFVQTMSASGPKTDISP